jgi:TolB-like protein
MRMDYNIIMAVMKKNLLLAACLLLAAQSSFGTPIRIAVLDLTVQSDEPDRKHIGKGLCELMAVELAKADDLRLIDRTKRDEVLEESEPAARYVLSGDIADQDGTVSVKLRLVDALSAQGIWTMQWAGDLADYNLAVESLAHSILEHLGLSMDHRTGAKRERKQKGAEEALIAFSEAIDHYDRNESSEAKIDLARAKRIDPKNEAVLIYLDKLITNTPNFKSTTNPAYLGILQYDQWFLFVYGDLPVWSLESRYSSYCSSGGRMVMGYSLPVGKRVGIQMNLAEDRSFSGIFYGGSFPDPFDSIIVQNRLTAQVSVGWAVSEYCSLGFSTALGWQFPRLYNYDLLSASWSTAIKHVFPPAFAIGVLVHNSRSTVMLDFLAGYSLGKQYGWQNEDVLLFQDPDEVQQPFTLENWARPPILLEGTLTFAIMDRRVFLAVRQANEIYLDEGYQVARLVPALELQLAEWVSVRAGFPASLYLSSGTIIDHGFGCSGGLTVRLSRKGWYLDMDGFFTSRTATNWYYEGLSRSRSSMFIGVTRNLLSKAR